MTTPTEQRTCHARNCGKPGSVEYPFLCPDHWARLDLREQWKVADAYTLWAAGTYSLHQRMLAERAAIEWLARYRLL